MKSHIAMCAIMIREMRLFLSYSHMVDLAQIFLYKIVRAN